MKFSYTLLKKLSPTIKAKTLAWLENRLTETSFEVDEIKAGTIEVAILPNRFSDAASHFGLAAEIEATEGRRFKWPEERIKLKEIKKELEVVIRDKDLCNRYMGVVVEIGKKRETSNELQKILIETGQRPVSPVVDIMNYVMSLTGQPLHAFDYDKLAGGDKKKIIVRRAKAGEVMVTLDKQKLELTEEDLVIADEAGPLALAGVKGGERAEVDEGTTRIVVEAANFDQTTVFKAAKRHKIQTEAGLRLSHNLSPILVEMAMGEAVRELQKGMKGEIRGGEDKYINKQKSKEVTCTADYLEKITGVVLVKGEIKKILTDLNFKVTEKSKNFKVMAPEWRTDITSPAEVVEEIIRIYGISQVPLLVPEVSLEYRSSDEMYQLTRETKDILAGLGYDEVYLSSFTDRNNSGKGLELANPIALDRRYLRENLGDGLVKAAEENARFFETVEIFETGKVWPVGQEETRVGLLMRGEREEVFLELKGRVEEWLRRIGVENFDFIETGKGGEYKAGKIVIGLIEIRGGVEDKEIAGGEFYLEKINQVRKGEKRFKPIIKYPAARRDISCLVDREIKTGEMIKMVSEDLEMWVKEIEVIDYFDDEKRLGKGKKSITFKIILQSDKKSLEEKEIEETIGKIEATWRDKFGAEIR